MFNFEKFEGEMFEILRSTAQKYVKIQRNNSRECISFINFQTKRILFSFHRANKLIVFQEKKHCMINNK